MRNRNFLGQLCRLDTHFAVKQVFLQRLTAQFLFKQLKFGFIVDVIQILEDLSLSHVISNYINNGIFATKLSWKRQLIQTLEDRAIVLTDNDTDRLFSRFRSTQSEGKRCYLWELAQKFPHILPACKSIVKMIALTYSSYQPETICSACGSFVTEYVDHCLLWCPGNAHLRHKMWLGFWRQFDIELYIRLAGLANDTFLDVLFGRYDVIADIMNDINVQKEDFYCYSMLHGSYMDRKTFVADYFDPAIRGF